MPKNARAWYLIVDGLALVGIVAFSVLAALNRDTDVYIIGQIVAALVLLTSIGLQYRAGKLPRQ